MINDGKLDVGIFVSEAMVELSKGDQIVYELRSLLEKLAGKAKA